MMKFILSFLVLFVLASLQLNAQDTLQTKSDKRLQKVLGMNKEQYKSYNGGLKQYNKKMAEIMKDPNLNRGERGAAIAKVLNERRAYVESHLTEDQRQKLHEFNKQNVTVSPRQKHQKEAEERMKKRGIRIIASNQ